MSRSKSCGDGFSLDPTAADCQYSNPGFLTLYAAAPFTSGEPHQWSQAASLLAPAVIALSILIGFLSLPSSFQLSAQHCPVTVFTETGVFHTSWHIHVSPSLTSSKVSLLKFTTAFVFLLKLLAAPTLFWIRCAFLSRHHLHILYPAFPYSCLLFWLPLHSAMLPLRSRISHTRVWFFSSL